MEFPSLSKNNIFPIPAGNFWQVEPERIYILYAPLNGYISLAPQKVVEALEQKASGKIDEKAKSQMLSTFESKGNVPVHHFSRTPHELYQIDILTNYTCNFKCTYCYSAAGRSSGQVDFSQIKPVIDYLFCSSRKQARPYMINFSGGGEPLLSFPLIKQTIEYIESVASGKDYKYNIGLVTNGSLITPEIVEYFKSKKIDMAVSFEILKYFQNLERGSYDKVAANIDMMLDMEYSFGIRTTFTPDSVCQMTQMVEELSIRFPRLKQVVFDTVLSNEIFKTPEMLKDYCDNFLKEYFAAKERGKKLNIKVQSIAVETLSLIRDRACKGKIALTPMGSISICARISSPKESLYDKYIYGNVENGVLNLDEEKFCKIIDENNIYSQDFCYNCFAKWNCGGGCRLFHQSFSPEFLKVKCNFTKQALKQELFNLLQDNHRHSQKEELQDSINNKIKANDI